MFVDDTKFVSVSFEVVFGSLAYLVTKAIACGEDCAFDERDEYLQRAEKLISMVYASPIVARSIPDDGHGQPK